MPTCKHPWPYRDMQMRYHMKKQIRTTGQAIQHYCRTMGITYTDLARLVDPFARKYGCRFSYANVYSYVAQGYSPKSEKLAALSLATGVPVVYWTGYANFTFRPPKH